MIKGLEHFTKHFADSADDFVVVGGVAAHEIMGSEGLAFRATKDIDLVIVARPATEFCKRLVAYVDAGKYEVRQSKDGKPAYFRFMKPKEADYPAQIEIFCRRPDDIELHGDQHIVPIKDVPLGTALSAILLEDDYFDLIRNTIQRIKGLPVASTEAVMALKSRAFNDLTDRRAAGDATASADEIKKHRNDILRLSQALSEQSKIQLTGLPETHMRRFLAEIEGVATVELKQLFKQFGLSDDPAIWVREMRNRFLAT